MENCCTETDLQFGKLYYEITFWSLIRTFRVLKIKLKIQLLDRERNEKVVQMRKH